MSSYVVAYDLHTVGQKYECLHKKLRGYGTYFHIQGSVWLIATSQTASQIRDNLLGCLDTNDKLFVGKLSGEAAWYGYSEADNKWIRNNI